MFHIYGRLVLVLVQVQVQVQVLIDHKYGTYVNKKQ